MYNPDEEFGTVRNKGMLSLQDVKKSTILTPLIEPLAASLHSSLLSTHCYACFRPLNSSTTIIDYKLVNYCNLSCQLVDSALYDRSGEYQLLNIINEKPHLWRADSPSFHDHSYLRLCLRVLLLLPSDLVPVLNPYDSHTSPPPYFSFPPRFLGLAWISENQCSTAVRASCLMSHAKKLRQGITDDEAFNYLACRVFTMVISNALKIENLGVALYDFRISWINHSCDPNSVVSFVDSFQLSQSHPQSSLLIHPTTSKNIYTSYEDYTEPPLESQDVSAPIMVSDIPHYFRNFGPRVFVKTIRPIKEGEEVLISYVDSSDPMEYDKLSLVYHFTCTCKRCLYRGDDGDFDGAQETNSVSIAVSPHEDKNENVGTPITREKKQNPARKTMHSLKKVNQMTSRLLLGIGLVMILLWFVVILLWVTMTYSS